MKKVSQVTESHVIVYYAPRLKKTTASSMCPNDEKFTRVIVAGLSRTARIRLAGNAIIGFQARLMLQRGLATVGNIDLRGIL